MGRQNPVDWNKVYRLTLIEDRTHRRVSSVRLSPLGLLVGGITAFVVLFGVFYGIMALTPLKVTLPGYPDGHSKREAVANAIKIDSLESAVTRWSLYAATLSRVLSGEETLPTADSLVAGGGARYLRALSQAEAARQDSLLRQSVIKEEQFSVSDRNERRLPIEGMHFFTPLKGTVSQGFDRVLHPAVDITAPAGAVVSAVLDGTVIFAGWTDETGYTLQIQHAGDIVSSYRHNQKLLRKVGEKVRAGSPVALVGSTGSLTSGDHLHFELWFAGEPVDPAKYCKL
ncbi:MAG: peptidoglycan DD-metalloendopeptidase family protein [Bacteroidales bacterium]|nr:peptidoglycan DD-metalloendopeptidase family protein [Bacteroidales bacterium]